MDEREHGYHFGRDRRDRYDPFHHDARRHRESRDYYANPDDDRGPPRGWARRPDSRAVDKLTFMLAMRITNERSVVVVSRLAKWARQLEKMTSIPEEAFLQYCQLIGILTLHEQCRLPDRSVGLALFRLAEQLKLTENLPPEEPEEAPEEPQADRGPEKDPDTIHL